MKNVTLALRAGIWTAAIQSEFIVSPPSPSDLPSVGIDRGITVFAALSDGRLIAPADFGKRAMKSLARAQRRLSRKQKGSNNRAKQVRKVSRLYLRVANSRRDFLHKISTDVAKNHGAVVLEKLKVRNMVRASTGLNRAILEQGWSTFKAMLEYKLTERGGMLVEVPAAYTSQTCSACGAIDADSRRGQRFHCTACGHAAHADTNAAIEILRRWGTPLLPVEASRQRAVEAGTIGRAA